MSKIRKNYYNVQQTRTVSSKIEQVSTGFVSSYSVGAKKSDQVATGWHQPVYVVILCSILLDECSNLLDMIVHVFIGLQQAFFHHFEKNSGRRKTQVLAIFGKTQPNFSKTQVNISQKSYDLLNTDSPKLR